MGNYVPDRWVPTYLLHRYILLLEQWASTFVSPDDMVNDDLCQTEHNCYITVLQLAAESKACDYIKRLSYSEVVTNCRPKAPGWASQKRKEAERNSRVAS